MKIPMIPMKRASEELVTMLIRVGVLEVAENGMKCADPGKKVILSEEDSLLLQQM